MMKRKLLLSPRAENDLVDIGTFISLDNPARAVSFVTEIQTFLENLAVNPLIGRQRPDLRTGLRSIPFVGYSYTIYYRALPRREGVKIERILHGARDFSRLL